MAVCSYYLESHAVYFIKFQLIFPEKKGIILIPKGAIAGKDMNKALHVLVYFFLIIAGVGLWLEIELNAMRTLLTDRNRMQEDYLVKIAATIEKVEPNKDVQAEIRKDVSSVEAKLVDNPEMENVLENYNYYLEQANLETFKWNDDKTRNQLRMVYVLDAEGKPMMDGDRPKMTGHGTEDELLSMLFEASKSMQTKLNTTRNELAELRKKLEQQINELNRLKPEARQDKVTIVERDAKIAKLEAEKADLENQIVKIKAQIDELNAEITSLKDEVATAQDETEAAKDEIQKKEKMIENLKKLLAEALAAQQTGGPSRGTAVTTIAVGDKGRIVTVDNENMYAVVEFTPEAMKQLKGDDLSHPLPNMEFGVKRIGFNGPAGEFTGRIRLRQEVKGKNYVICDVLGQWEQTKLEVGDVVYAD